MALKGGTALNLFVFDLPRLSVDIDLNYTGAADRETALAERPQVEKALEGIFRRHGLMVRKSPNEHAGGSWSLRYPTAIGADNSLKVDVNFLLRVPLFDPVRCSAQLPAGLTARDILVLTPCELAAGKLAALFGRQAARDLYDTTRLLALDEAVLPSADLSLAFVVYGAMSRTDWRGIGADSLRADPADLNRLVSPLLRRGLVFDEAAAIELVSQCRRQIGERLLPFTPAESDFLERLLEAGDIAPELLTPEPELQERLRVHPGLLWKAHHIRLHRQRTTAV